MPERKLQAALMKGFGKPHVLEMLPEVVKACPELWPVGRVGCAFASFAWPASGLRAQAQLPLL